MRTSWKVGLATGALDPVPCATPRTKVVLPAPSSPTRRTTSPARSRSPRSIPARSVSAAELATNSVPSGKVVVARPAKLDRGSAGVDDLDLAVLAVLGHRPHDVEPCLSDQVLGPDADELRLLAARERVFHRRPGGAGDVLAPHHAA